MIFWILPLGLKSAACIGEVKISITCGEDLSMEEARWIISVSNVLAEWYSYMSIVTGDL